MRNFTRPSIGLLILAALSSQACGSDYPEEAAGVGSAAAPLLSAGAPLICLPGSMRGNDGGCYYVPQGSYMPYTNYEYAFECPGGYSTASYGATSSAQCNVRCDPGNYTTHELYDYHDVSFPFYRVVFKPCEPGTYAPYTGMPSCYRADVDHYVPGGGASFELACPAGTHQPVTGSTSCVPLYKDQTITFDAPADQIVGATLALHATATSGLAVAFRSLTPDICSVTGPSVTVTATGTCTLQATQAGNASWNAAAPKLQSLEVTYGFVGFSQPVDGNGTLNSASAGKTIPLKWRVVDADLNPIADLADVTVQAVTLSCALGATPDTIEEYAAGASGLQNLGDGYYQWNWKTPTSYAKSCKTLTLDLGDGSAHTALFFFNK